MASYSQTQLDALRAAIATGALTVHYEDRTVTYRTLDEMLKLERIISTDLSGSAGDRWSVTAYSRE